VAPCEKIPIRICGGPALGQTNGRFEQKITEETKSSSARPMS
jgi:hypothetical protein